MLPIYDNYASMAHRHQKTARNLDVPPTNLLNPGTAKSRPPHLRDELQLGSTAAPARSQERHWQSEDKERLYQHIFEAASDGLIINDVETGLVVEANPAASAMHGFIHEEFIDLHPTTYIHPDSFPQFSEWVQVIQSGNDFAAIAVHVRRDGSPFTVNRSR